MPATPEDLRSAIAAASGRRKIMLLLSLARQVQSNEPAQALAAAQEAWQLVTAPGMDDPRRAAECRLLLGTCHRAAAHFEEAQRCAEDARQRFAALNDPAHTADALLLLGSVHSKLGDYRAALEAYREAIVACACAGHERAKTIALSGLGSVYLELGDHSRALEHFQQSARLAAELGDTYREAMAHNNIAVVYCCTKQYAKALTTYQHSLPYWRASAHRDATAGVLANIGGVCHMLDLYHDALCHYQESLAMREAINDLPGTASVLNNMGETQHAVGNFDAALHCYRRSLALARKIKYRQLMVFVYLTLGKLYATPKFKQRNTATAEDYYGKALRLATKLQIKEQFYEAHLALAELFAARGDHVRALRHYRRYHAVERDVFNEDSVLKQRNLEIAFEVEQARKTAEISKHANAQLQANEQQLAAANAQLQQALAELQETQQQLVKSERLRALGQMASGVAHDFNNTLQPMVLAITMLQHLKDDSAERETRLHLLDTIQRAAMHAASTVARLAQFYRPTASRTMAAVDLAGLVHDVIELTEAKWKEEAAARGALIEIETHLDPVCIVRGFRDELREVLINLLFNAVEAIATTGRITIYTCVDDSWVLMSVTDNGAGMAPATREHCLEPFYTTKTQTGTGLGLSVVHGIVQHHHGKIDIHSDQGVGTAVTIYLPRAPADEPAVPPAAATPAPSAGAAHTCRVLVVDDEPLLLQMLAETMRRHGHTVTAANNGTAAWDICATQTFDLVITDQAMPDLPGTQLAAQIKQQHPTTRVILLTGFGDTALTSDDAARAIDLVIAKPVTGTALQQAVLALLQPAAGTPPA
jgi:signal transduction histidine kinase